MTTVVSSSSGSSAAPDAAQPAVVEKVKIVKVRRETIEEDVCRPLRAPAARVGSNGSAATQISTLSALPSSFSLCFCISLPV